jgi:hypothetical protein
LRLGDYSYVLSTNESVAINYLYELWARPLKKQGHRIFAQKDVRNTQLGRLFTQQSIVSMYICGGRNNLGGD